MNFTVREKQLVALALAVGLSVGMWLGLWSVPTSGLSVPTQPVEYASNEKPLYHPISNVYFLAPVGFSFLSIWYVWWIDPDLGPEPEGGQ